MKICTIFTGGTIGSTINEDGYIGPREGTPFRLLQLYRERFDDKTEFVVMEPYRILSENLKAKNLLDLKNAVQTALQQEDVKGIIITHGTDTLQYGSAILGYLFGNALVPIVVVSSNYVLEAERANGLINFQYAVEFIRGQYGKGVFVSYYNEGEFPTIHRATRLQPPVPYSDYVSSVGNIWYGRFEQGIYVRNPQYDVVKGNPAMFENTENIKLTDISGQILWIQPYVGMCYPELYSHTKVIIHGSFHSGTVCVDENLKDFAKRAKENGIPFYLTGVLTGARAYETVQEYRELGMIPLHTSAEIAQYCKLWLALSNDLDMQSVMNTSIAEDWVREIG